MNKYIKRATVERKLIKGSLLQLIKSDDEIPNPVFQIVDRFSIDDDQTACYIKISDGEHMMYIHMNGKSQNEIKKFSLICIKKFSVITFDVRTRSPSIIFNWNDVQWLGYYGSMFGTPTTIYSR